ncbi:MAG: creatininase family protein [Thermodesulfobacteriota bacterium]
MNYWPDLNLREFQEWRQQNRTVIIPVGSLEEHGPHLPLGTDTFHALEVARRVARLSPVLVAPPIFYGLCRSTRDHPGTVSISGQTLRSLILDLGRECYRQGLRNLVILSGHAGGTHLAALVEAGETLLAELPEAGIAIVNLLDLLREVVAASPGLVKTKGDSHAGEVETALMLAAYPHLVKGSAPAEWPAFPKYILVRDKERYWPGGVWGDPGQATVAQGEEILEAEARRLAEVIAGLEKK